MVHDTDADRLKLDSSVTSVGSGSPAGNPASITVSDVFSWQTDGLDGITVRGCCQNIFFELEQANVVVHSCTVITSVVVFGVDEDVVGCEREFVFVVVLEFVVLAEFTGDFLKSKVNQTSKKWGSYSNASAAVRSSDDPVLGEN